MGQASYYFGKEVYFHIILGHYLEVTLSDTGGKLRMKRTGNKMEGFYWNGAALQSIGSPTPMPA
jgi:hypothetical protein